MTKMTDMPIYGKNTLKTYFAGTTEQILMKLCMKHQRPNRFIICAIYDTGLTSIYFTTRSNIATKAFTWENVTMMDSLESIASCDLEFGLYSKLNE